MLQGSTIDLLEQSRRRTAVTVLRVLRLLLPSAVVYLLGGVLAASAQTETLSPGQVEFFETKVRPVLSNRCYSCHLNGPNAAAGLQLGSREGILKGGHSGAAVVPGSPSSSLLFDRVTTSDSKLRMPKGDDQPLPAEEIASLKTWIEQGAFWPASPKEAPVAQPHSTSGLYPRPATPEHLDYFEKNVRPILVNRCYNCHSDAFKEAGGLRVDVGIAIFNGGNDGPVLNPGHPEKSLLIQRVKTKNTAKRMPQESKDPLTDREISILETWIRDGAAWPDETEKLPPTPARLQSAYKKLRKDHWAWQPLTNPEVPRISDPWIAGDIDRFVLAKLQEKELAPVRDADPTILIRRLSFDLTGLPPSPADIKAFQKDHSPGSYRSLVDRLLASPQYGERWGRHWLDLARYAESSGPSRNMPYPNAWRYRDYVIDAMNRDVPYNRFIEEQLAGDLLPANSPTERDRLLIATGFLSLGPKDVNQRFKARYKMDNIDDQIDTITRSMLGLTVSCARCHDHKFDPIPTTDYYALASIFASTDDAAGLTSKMGGNSLQYYEPKLLGYLSTASQAPPVPRDAIEELKARTEQAKAVVDALPKPNEEEASLSTEQRKKNAELRLRYQHLREDYQLLTDLGERGYGVHSVRDGLIADTAVRIRGVEERHGPTVPRGFLSVVSFQNIPKIPENHSGRLELAQWISDPRNPLTARVYVNRVWQHLFGAGIVTTVDNFGSTGASPANAPLLDYLAQEFIREAWSTKRLVREIVLSHAYRLGSEVPPGYNNIDPADEYVWRHNPRRIESEEIRDSILASSGQLDLQHPHGSPSMALRMIEIRDDGPVVQAILAAADRSRYRSIYLPLLRGETPLPLAAFDPVAQTLVTGKREETTVPSQALFMLNSPFVREQALALADSILSRRRGDDLSRTREVYERVLGRAANPPDVARTKAFLSRYSAAWRREHPGQPVAKTVSAPSVPSQEPITAGIPHADDLNQDDTVEDRKPPKQLVREPECAQEAAWAAFIQALYGSAEFQFVR